MKKFSKKAVLLFAGAMALCAFAMPSMAAASSWGIVGTHQTLDSPDVGYTSTTAVGTIVAQCTNSSLTTDVTSAQNLTITTGTFGGQCTALIAGSATCNMSLNATRFPWRATAVTTNNIQIHGVHIDQRFSQSALGTCPAALIGQNLTITGTLTGGRWTGNNAGQREIILSNAEGLVQHSALGNGQQLTFRGTFGATGALSVTG
jgi:hypothetical protein